MIYKYTYYMYYTISLCDNNDRIYVALCCCLGAFVDSIYVRL